jgi:hypothetical protein
VKLAIAVLCHARQGETRYTIHDYAAVWREDGHRVTFLFGPDAYEPADVALLHVNLSVVPAEYLALAARYPVALNARARDIRKSTFSTLRVRRSDPWSGPVIVKSDLNYGGAPEVLHGVVAPPNAERVKFRSPLDYRVVARIDDVAAADWDDPSVIVERFVPEMERGRFVTRVMSFFGDRATAGKLLGPRPVVNGATQSRIERVEPHPQMLRLRRTLGIDFGKLDYVLGEDGEPILLDVNKTTGTRHVPMTRARAAARRFRAEGLYAYMDRAAR